MTARKTPLLSLAVVAVATAVFVVVTAFEGGNTINIPAPSLGDTLVAGIVAVFGFFGQRAIKKLDAIGDKTDATHQDFTEFRTEMRTVLVDVDGRGGLVNDVRDLQSAVFRDAGVSPPVGFSVAPPIAAAKREDPS